MKQLLFIAAVFMSLNAAAQTDSTASPSDTATVIMTTDSTSNFPVTDTTVMVSATPQPGLKPAAPKVAYPKNLVKFNIGSLVLFKNYNFTVERALTRKMSISASYRTMGTRQVSQLQAFKLGYKAAGEDQRSLDEDWSGMRASNKTATLEFRLYGGRKPGPRGFYLGVYGRYAKFDTDFDYVYEGDGKDYLIPLKTTAKGIGGGLYVGVQWLIGKRVALDWQIIGGHWGKLTGNGSGAADLSELSALEKRFIEAELEDRLPSVSGKSIIAADVTNTGATVKLDGPFAGLRSGISIGIAF